MANGRGAFRLVLRMVGDARHLWPHLLGIFFCSLAATPLSLLMPIPVKIIVDNVVGHAPLPRLLAWLPGSPLALAAALALVFALAQSAQNLGLWIYQRYLGERLVTYLRAKTLSHIQRLSLQQHGARGTADLLYSLQSDVQNVQYFLIAGLVPFVVSALSLLAMFVVTIRLDLALALLALPLLPLYWLAALKQEGSSRRLWARVKTLDSDSVSVLQETLQCVRVVKAFGGEEAQTRKYCAKAKTYFHAYLKAMASDSAFTFLMAAALALVTAASIFLGISHVQSGRLSLGDFLVVMAYLAQLLKSVEELSRQTATSRSAFASAERLYALLDEAPELAPRLPTRSLKRASGAIEFRSVGFCFPTGQEALRNVSFTVAPGTRVGIIGPNGAGKTTLLGLLLRFYDPTSGSILLDGVDLRDIQPKDLCRQFSLVPQDPVLFADTIAENIAYGRASATSTEIIAAAKAAGAHDFIVKLPLGYKTQVGERGGSLSGGERQRLAIARAFLVDAPFLLLDEPTSSLDEAMGHELAETIERLHRDRTTFTISHRPSLLRNCDVIFELRAGRLA